MTGIPTDVATTMNKTTPDEKPVSPGPRLLLVDDEPNTLSALRRLFRREGYELLMAGSGREGLALLDEHEVGVIISDYRMPNMTGVEFLREVKTRFPDTLRIVLSGFTDLESVTSAVNEGAVYKFLTKPWNDDELRRVTREAFRLCELQRANRRLTDELSEANRELARFNQELERRVEEKTRHLEIHAASLKVSQEMLDNLPVAVLGVDMGGAIVYANARAGEVFTTHRAGLLGMELIHVLPTVYEAIKESTWGREDMEVSHPDGSSMRISAQSMGRTSNSSGWVITCVERPEEQDAD